MNLGYAMSFMFYMVPAFIGALAAWIFVKRETKGKSLDQLVAEEVRAA